MEPEVLAAHLHPQGRVGNPGKLPFAVLVGAAPDHETALQLGVIERESPDPQGRQVAIRERDAELAAGDRAARRRDPARERAQFAERELEDGVLFGHAQPADQHLVRPIVALEEQAPGAGPQRGDRLALHQFLHDHLGAAGDPLRLQAQARSRQEGRRLRPDTNRRRAAARRRQGDLVGTRAVELRAVDQLPVLDPAQVDHRAQALPAAVDAEGAVGLERDPAQGPRHLLRIREQSLAHVPIGRRGGHLEVLPADLGGSQEAALPRQEADLQDLAGFQAAPETALGVLNEDESTLLMPDPQGVKVLPADLRDLHPAALVRHQGAVRRVEVHPRAAPRLLVRAEEADREGARAVQRDPDRRPCLAGEEVQAVLVAGRRHPPVGDVDAIDRNPAVGVTRGKLERQLEPVGRQEVAVVRGRPAGEENPQGRALDRDLGLRIDDLHRGGGRREQAEVGRRRSRELQIGQLVARRPGVKDAVRIPAPRASQGEGEGALGVGPGDLPVLPGHDGGPGDAGAVSVEDEAGELAEGGLRASRPDRGRSLRLELRSQDGPPFGFSRHRAGRQSHGRPGRRLTDLRPGLRRLAGPDRDPGDQQQQRRRRKENFQFR